MVRVRPVAHRVPGVVDGAVGADALREAEQGVVGEGLRARRIDGVGDRGDVGREIVGVAQVLHQRLSTMARRIPTQDSLERWILETYGCCPAPIS